MFRWTKDNEIIEFDLQEALREAEIEKHGNTGLTYVIPARE